MLTPHISNMNFPAPLAVMAFLAAAAGVVLALAAAAIAWFARKPKLARACLLVRLRRSNRLCRTPLRLLPGQPPPHPHPHPGKIFLRD